MQTLQIYDDESIFIDFISEDELEDTIKVKYELDLLSGDCDRDEENSKLYKLRIKSDEIQKITKPNPVLYVFIKDDNIGLKQYIFTAQIFIKKKV